MFFQFTNKESKNIDNKTEMNTLEILKSSLTQSFMITVLNSAGKVLEINENFIKTFDYSLPELYMQNYWILNSGYHSEAFLKEIWHTIEMGEQWSGELCQRGRNGKLFWVKATFIPIREQEASPLQVIIVTINITDQKELEKWKYLSYHQNLTDLPNRRMLDLSIDAFISKAKQKKQKLAVLYMDINRFKAVNDSYGHLVGDLLLTEIGNRLNSLLTLRKCVFHPSGDEFVIIIEDVENIDVHIQSIMDLFNKQFLIDKHEIHVSVSVGMSIYPDHHMDARKLIKYADLAMSMFQAKEQSGNTFKSYESAMGIE